MRLYEQEQKRLHFQVGVEDVSCLGTKHTESPFSAQSRPQGYPDA